MATNQVLKQLVDELKVAQVTASEDLSGWDPRTVAGAQLRKNMAQDDVRRLTSAYKTAVQGALFRVFLGGSRDKTFGEFVAKDAVVIVVDGSELYSNLARGVADTQDPQDRKFGPTQLSRLTMELTYHGMSENYRSLMAPVIAEGDLDTPSPTYEDLVAKVRRAIRATNGDDLNRLYLEKLILKQAVDRGMANTIIPVIITGLSVEEIQELYKGLFAGSPAIDFTIVDESTDAEALKALYKKIQSVVKTTKQ
jgi:hypothetical protein